jgi:hypothetical protein
LIAAIVEKKVNELSYHGMKDVTEFFEKKLGLQLFTDRDDLFKAALHVDIRNLITHNRGIVNRIFQQRQPTFPAELGTSIVFKNDREVGEIIGWFVYCARQLDWRAAEKFDLPTILPLQNTVG